MFKTIRIAVVAVIATWVFAGTTTAGDYAVFAGAETVPVSITVPNLIPAGGLFPNFEDQYPTTTSGMTVGVRKTLSDTVSLECSYAAAKKSNPMAHQVTVPYQVISGGVITEFERVYRQTVDPAISSIRLTAIKTIAKQDPVTMYAAGTLSYNMIDIISCTSESLSQAGGVPVVEYSSRYSGSIRTVALSAGFGVIVKVNRFEVNVGTSFGTGTSAEFDVDTFNKLRVWQSYTPGMVDRQKGSIQTGFGVSAGINVAMRL